MPQWLGSSTKPFLELPVAGDGEAGSSRRAGFLRGLAINAATAAVIAIALELSCRHVVEGCLLEPPVYESSSESPGYRLARGKQARVWQFGRAVSVSTDPAGHRTTVGNPTAAARRVEVIGDSQVFGWGLSDEETLPSQLQQLLGEEYAVSNHGVPGYGPLEYRRELDAFDDSEVEPWVVLVLTEQNDLDDAFGERWMASAVCGYMTTRSSFLGQITPCWLRSSRALQWGAARLRDAEQQRLPAPLGFDDSSQVAASVLSARVEGVVDAARARYGRRLITTYVPWSASYSPERRKHFVPNDRIKRTFPLSDDCGVDKAFDREPSPESLYLVGDDHLSRSGARLLATLIAKRIASLSGAVDQKGSHE